MIKQFQTIYLNFAYYQERRKNLHGRDLLVSTLNLFPSAFFNDDTNSYHGLSIDILNYCQVQAIRYIISHPSIFPFYQNQMNFSLTYTSPPDNAFGAPNPDGTWNGIVRQLQDRQIDIW